MLKKNNKPVFYCEIYASMVPFVAIKKKMSTGTIAVKHTVCLRGGKNRKPRYYADNADLHCQWMLETQPTPPSPPNGPGSPQCGDPALVEAVDRPEMVTTCAKTAAVSVRCRSVRHRRVRSGVLSEIRPCKRCVACVSVPAFRWPVVRSTVRRPGCAAATTENLRSKSTP